MVIYDLMCATHHHFEGWFKDQAECQRQMESGLVVCPYCESTTIQRLPSAAHIRKLSTARDPATLPAESAKQHAVVEVLEKLHQYVAANFEDHGTQFAVVARRMHNEEEPRRDIRGSASAEELAELREEGVPVLALPPVVDKSKLN